MQRRLVALGFTLGNDEAGTFGAGTVTAITTFQARRGIRTDGTCGDQTWSVLVEAGYRLGDRVLYLTQPMLRGDDVAELQRQLGALGFDAGRVDGIFGTNTDRALADFQRNAGLVTDGICGPATVTGLARLGGWRDAPHSIAAVREREWLRRGPRSLAGRVLAVAEPGGLDALARAVAGSVSAAGGRVLLLQHYDGSELASRANTARADAFVYVGVGDGAGGPFACSTAYYRAASGWESPEGRRLAELLQTTIRFALDAKDAGVRGMAIPVLRETRMPAVVLEVSPAAAAVERSVDIACGVASSLRAWVEG